MGAVRWGILLLCLLAFMPAARASPRLSTQDAYGEILGLGVDLRCYRTTTSDRERAQDEHVYARLRSLRPWLERALGPGVRQAMVDANEAEVRSVYFTGCPSDEDHSRARTRLRTLVNELQNRARQDGFRPVRDAE
jgi:hypothetical protein